MVSSRLLWHNKSTEMRHPALLLTLRRASWSGWFLPITQGGRTKLLDFLFLWWKSPWLSLPPTSLETLALEQSSFALFTSFSCRAISFLKERFLTLQPVLLSLYTFFHTFSYLLLALLFLFSLHFFLGREWPSSKPQKLWRNVKEANLPLMTELPYWV